jgi:short-subunit dehydrogenase
MATADAAASVVVTGASQGIGKAILLALARSGQSVLGVSRSKPQELANSTQSSEAEYASWRPLDLSNAANVAEFASSLEPMAIRALVLSAVDYGSTGRRPSSETSAEEWQKVIATNCIGQCVLVSRLLPKLVLNFPGIIVHISSDVAILPGSGRAAYAASKAGLHAMLRAVAAENSIGRLRVYQLIPTFQSLTEGIRRRRAIDFDFSSYVDPALLAQLAKQIVTSPGSSIGPGSYLVHRDGTMSEYPERTQI